MSYVDVFSGDIVQPVEVSYRAVALTADVTLVWPTLSETSADVAARIMDVTPSGGGLTITLPPATQVGVGADALFRNLGASAFDIESNSGGAIVTVAPGVTVYMYSTDNTTVGGSWQVFTFGTGTSAADASALAGAGLEVAAGKLQWAPSVVELSSSPLIFGAGGEGPAVVYRWTGGALVATLAAASTSGDGFIFSFRNDGSGTATFTRTGGDTVDGNTAVVLNPGDSAFFISDGVATWAVIGLGRAATFAFSFLVKDITAGGIITLNGSESTNKIIKLVGVPALNASVNVPAVPSVYWTNNQATGAKLVFFGVAGVSDFTVQLVGGGRQELVCDGIDLYKASDVTIGSFLFAFGAIGAPAIGFVGSTLGFYHDAGPNRLDLTVDGLTNAAQFGATGIEVLAAGASSIYGPGYLNLGSNALPGADVQLSMASTTQGFLPPRMTTAQRTAIGAPSTGLVVFDTDTDSLSVKGASVWSAVVVNPVASLTGSDTSLDITGLTPGAGGGGQVVLNGGLAVGGNNTGGSVQVLPGLSTGTAQGGGFNLLGGQGGPTAGVGGPVTIVAGTAGAGGVGGLLTLAGGVGSTDGGNASLAGGNPGVAGNGGSVSITGAAGAGAGTGGSVTLIAGSGTATGVISFIGGSAILASALTAPSASALLQMNSTTQGFLPPRMTTTQRDNISTPAEGLVIYNTSTKKLNFRDDAAWRVVTST